VDRVNEMVERLRDTGWPCQEISAEAADMLVELRDENERLTYLKNVLHDALLTVAPRVYGETYDDHPEAVAVRSALHEVALEPRK
jgi:hypothetical protein